MGFHLSVIFLVHNGTTRKEATRMRILIIEDDYHLNQALKKSLVEEGYATDSVYDGVEGEAYAESTPYDAIILDIRLPRKDGIAVCRALRQHHITTPILMLTARDTIEDRVQGLDSGAHSTECQRIRPAGILHAPSQSGTHPRHDREPYLEL